MDYYCKVCSTEVYVSKAGEVVRNCAHSDATVVAERTSILYGAGNAKGLTLQERVQSALRVLISAFKK